MKQLRYLIPILLCAVLAAGCLKSENVPPAITPDGNFGGEFRLISRNAEKKTVDTVKAIIKLSLTQANGSFTVTGDTATVHAGSKGQYAVNGNAIGFSDKTLSAVNADKAAPIVSSKAHLNGVYLFAYNGNVLQMKAVVGDTVAFEYDLKRVN
jgi:hypothetical protein